MGFLQQLREQIRVLWEHLEPSQRMFLGLLLCLAVVGSVLLLFWAGRQDYLVLYSNLNHEDAGAVIERLRDNKIPYRLKDRGGTILVPAGSVNEARLDLAQEGLPTQVGTGYEIFDRNTIGMTEFLQQLNFQRALEGELTRTIETMEEIQGARVHIVNPRPSLFAEEQQEPSASILLRLRPGASVSRTQVQGICHLVASSVEGLNPEQVTVVDDHGTILSSPGQGDDGTATAERLYVQQSVENYLVGKAQALLESVLGPGRAMVRVNVELNTERVDRTTERYDPEGQVVRSEERSEISAAAEGGDKSNAITNYEITRTVEHLLRGTGGIERLSAAILVDGEYTTTTGPNGEEETTFVPRGDEELQGFATMVRNAIGFVEERGDKVEINCVPFRPQQQEDMGDQPSLFERNRFIGLLIRHLGTAAIVIALVMVFRSVLREVGKASPIPAPTTARARGPVAGAPEDQEKYFEPALPQEDSAAKTREVQINEMAHGDPQAVARVVRSWLGET